MICMSQTVATTRRHTPKPGQSLAEVYPDTAAEWDTEANGGLRPADVTKGSGRIVAWLCPAGHGSYMKQVFARTSQGKGCPTCARIKAYKLRHGKTLAQVFPEVAALWDYEKNYPLTPDDVAPRSNKKAFFKCPEGHASRESFISNRTAGNGCLECSRDRRDEANFKAKKTLARNLLAAGSIAELRPDNAAEWDYSKNTVTPAEVHPSSTKRYWWICSAGHDSFLFAPTNKVPGKNCPICTAASRLAAIAYTGPKAGRSLAELRPEIAADWDTALNTLTAAGVAPYSRATAHWLCASGHRSEDRIGRRTANGGCLACPVDQRPGRQAA